MVLCQCGGNISLPAIHKWHGIHNTRFDGGHRSQPFGMRWRNSHRSSASLGNFPGPFSSSRGFLADYQTVQLKLRVFSRHHVFDTICNVPKLEKENVNQAKLYNLKNKGKARPTPNIWNNNNNNNNNNIIIIIIIIIINVLKFTAPKNLKWWKWRCVCVCVCVYVCVFCILTGFVFCSLHSFLHVFLDSIGIRRKSNKHKHTHCWSSNTRRSGPATPPGCSLA